MTLSKTGGLGTPRETSTNPTKRGGRDAGLDNGQKGRGTPRSTSSNPTSRGGRGSGTGPVGPARGIGRGGADSGSTDGVDRKADGVGRELPSP